MRPAGGLRLAVVLGLAGLAACGPREVGRPSVAPLVAGGTWGNWRTLRAEHKAQVTARAADGSEESRALRGVIAVERPGRFRLRALGPGGITLFDLLSVDGKPEVVASLRDPRGDLFSRLLASIGGDLSAAYDLAPRPGEEQGGRAVRLDGAEVVVEERGRTVRLSDFRESGRGPAPTRMAIDNRDGSYRVRIEAEGTVLDEPLDPELFVAPAR